MISGQFIVLRQVLLLLMMGAGYACWLWRLGRQPPRQRAHTYIWFGLAGFCVNALLLNSLVYFGVPLRFTAWPALAISALGVSLTMRNGRAWRALFFSREFRLYALVFIVSFLGQAPGLLTLGPARYFGSESYDHANYVVTAEFLRTEPFATQAEDVGYRPWLLKAVDIKEQRLAQCVVLGTLGELDGRSAQEAYGSVSVFFVALMGVATTAWLRSSGLPRGAAGWAGLAAALTPALTRIHLDGFFAQTSTLFVYPALAGVVGARGNLTRGTKVCAGVFLGFLIGSYTEVAAFGLALTATLIFARGRPWRQRAFDLAAIFAGALLLNLGYLGRLPDFLFGQVVYASTSNILSTLFPESGTWLGWGRLFADLSWPPVVVGAGLMIAGLGLWGALGSRSSWRQWRWGIILGVALLPLLLLRVTMPFPNYAFAKITVHFVPIWIGAAMAGVVTLAGHGPWSRKIVWACGCLGTITAFVTAMPHHLKIIRPSGWMAVLSSDALLQTRREAEANPQRAYLVAHSCPLVAQWLCYFGRKSEVVFERRVLGDMIVPTEMHAFRRWSGPPGDLWWLDPQKKGRVENYESPPVLTVRGAMQEGRRDSVPYYVVKDTVDFVFRRGQERQSSRVAWLDFFVVPLLQGQGCKLVLEDSAQKTQQATVHSPGWQRWQVALPPGESSYRLHVTFPSGFAGPNGNVLLQLFSVEVALDLLPNDPKPAEASGNL